MKNVMFTIRENRAIALNTFRLELAGDVSAIAGPGQFVNLSLPGRFLRRPLSVCDYAPGQLTLVYKAVGQGTLALSQLPAGVELELLTGLGTGYELEKSGPAPLLLGGGAGAAPLYALAKSLRARGCAVTVVLGFNTAAEVFYEAEFAALGAAVTVTTLDGSRGQRGFVTNALPPEPTCYYACGPEPMLRAVYRSLPGPGQLSLEARMGCGFGACMGCSIQTTAGVKRVCRDGPVFDKEVLPWT